MEKFEPAIFIQSESLIDLLIEKKAIEKHPFEKMADAFFGFPVYLDPKLPADELHIVDSHGKRQVFKITAK